ncbi:response regulator [Microvirga puerhi]|uniref:Response regulator n=1 Tax=Microvirga puerhi TaxID=2876078 RepID=A0ABS7VJC1_9HYPH|nr:response regulator [Microvirga puerhi]MBZ6075613.1 response regulator [Microvirga puerhi]
MFRSHTENNLGSRRILVVEDEYFIAEDMVLALQSAGLEVVGPAPNPELALSLLAAERVDAAILDLNLQGLSVYPVARVLRSRGIPFVFASGFDHSSIPSEFQDVPHWEKPFDIHCFVQALPKLLSPL